MTDSIRNAAAAALALIRDREVTIEDLAHCLGQSETWAAGLVEAVTGDADFAFAAQQQGYEPTPGEVADYQTGFRHGLTLMEIVE